MVNFSSTPLPFWKSLLLQLKSRNRILYFVTLFNLLGVAICLVLVITTNLEVRGVNAFIKPLKFFIAIALTAFTMAWILVYLKNQKVVRSYSWMLLIAMFIEVAIISGQATLGHISHFATAPLIDV